MEKLLIISHIICGGTVLLLGLFQMVNRKGGKSHRFIGKVYVGAMWWICASALLIISFYRFSAFLMVIAVLTFYASFTGVRVLRRKKAGTEKWYDWAVAIVTLLFGLGLIGYGVWVFLIQGHTILAFLCAVFGIFTAKAGFQDIRFFSSSKIPEKDWWLQQHIGAMNGSYIAAVTAFAVQNPNFFIPESGPQWLLWILPAIIGSPISTFARKRWSKRSAQIDAALPGST